MANSANRTRLSSGPPSGPPPNRGRLMTAQEIAQKIFRGHRSAEWVRRNLPGKKRMGHSTVMWWEAEVIKNIDLGFDHSLPGGLK